MYALLLDSNEGIKTGGCMYIYISTVKEYVDVLVCGHLHPSVFQSPWELTDLIVFD